MNERTPFEERTRELLAESAAKLDGRTRSRLTQARHAALAGAASRTPRWLRIGLPVGAAAAVLAVMVWTGPVNDPTAPQGPAVNGSSAFEDLDLLADAPEFVGEADDMEFYEWAAAEIES